MEYDLKTGPQGHIYFPKIIRQNLGEELKLLPNAEAGAIYPKDADLNRAIQSLEIIIADLKLRASRKWDDRNLHATRIDRLNSKKAKPTMEDRARRPIGCHDQKRGPVSAIDSQVTDCYIQSRSLLEKPIGKCVGIVFTFFSLSKRIHHSTLTYF